MVFMFSSIIYSYLSWEVFCLITYKANFLYLLPQSSCRVSQELQTNGEIMYIQSFGGAFDNCQGFISQKISLVSSWKIAFERIRYTIQFHSIVKSGDKTVILGFIASELSKVLYKLNKFQR